MLSKQKNRLGSQQLDQTGVKNAGCEQVSFLHDSAFVQRNIPQSLLNNNYCVPQKPFA